MAVKMKRSAVAGKVPTTAQLVLGELAINTHDGRLFLKRDDGTEAIVEIVNSGRQIAAGTGLTGGGSLAADRTLAADLASQAQAEAGTATDKLMNPLRVAQAIAALAPGGLPTLVPGDDIRSRRDAEATRTDSDYSTRKEFSFIQGGAVRIVFDHKHGATGVDGQTVRIRRLRNGSWTTVASYAPASTSFVTVTTDVSVKVGDYLSVEWRGNTTGSSKTLVEYPLTIRNVRIQTDGVDLYPGQYDEVEGNSV